MLVLSRHRGQAIMIGDVQVTVDSIGSDNVRLRITAPRELPVHRKEVYEAIRRGNQRAADPTPDDAGIMMGHNDDEAPAGHGPRRSHLSLTRRRNETIMIGDDVAVTVVDIRHHIWGNKVQLGITAPRDVQIHRQEVFEAIMRGESPSSEG